MYKCHSDSVVFTDTAILSFNGRFPKFNRVFLAETLAH